MLDLVWICISALPDINTEKLPMPHMPTTSSTTSNAVPILAKWFATLTSKTIVTMWNISSSVDWLLDQIMLIMCMGWTVEGSCLIFATWLYTIIRRFTYRSTSYSSRYVYWKYLFRCKLNGNWEILVLWSSLILISDQLWNAPNTDMHFNFRYVFSLMQIWEF